MKQLMLLLFIAYAFSSSAQQSRFTPKMAPVYESGYYINRKGDTIRGKIQINPQNEIDFYSQFAFKSEKQSKPRVFNTQSVKAYGFGDRNFVMAEVDGNKRYVERLAAGRLRFYEYQYLGKVNGYTAVESEYFIKDTGAEGEDVGLKQLRKLPKKFYKKALKPYMKDQPMIWSDLDKYTFDENSILASIKEFNTYFVQEGN